MKIVIRDGLPFVSVTIRRGKKAITLENVLLDTGSAGTIFPADKLRASGFAPRDTALIRRITGVGGDEFVVETAVDSVAVGHLQIDDFIIEAGAMDYNYVINGILGFDFLQQTSAMIDLGKMELRPLDA